MGMRLNPPPHPRPIYVEDITLEDGTVIRPGQAPPSPHFFGTVMLTPGFTRAAPPSSHAKASLSDNIVKLSGRYQIPRASKSWLRRMIDRLIHWFHNY